MKKDVIFLIKPNYLLTNSYSKKPKYASLKCEHIYFAEVNQ